MSNIIQFSRRRNVSKFPDAEQLSQRLNAAREWLEETDEDGSFEGMVALDMFRAAVLDDLPPAERSRRLLVGAAWLGAYLAGRDDLPASLRQRAAALDDAVGELPWL